MNVTISDNYYSLIIRESLYAGKVSEKFKETGKSEYFCASKYAFEEADVAWMTNLSIPYKPDRRKIDSHCLLYYGNDEAFVKNFNDSINGDLSYNTTCNNQCETPLVTARTCVYADCNETYSNGTYGHTYS